MCGLDLNHGWAFSLRLKLILAALLSLVPNPRSRSDFMPLRAGQGGGGRTTLETEEPLHTGRWDTSPITAQDTARLGVQPHLHTKATYGPHDHHRHDLGLSHTSPPRAQRDIQARGRASSSQLILSQPPAQSCPAAQPPPFRPVPACPHTASC